MTPAERAALQDRIADCCEDAKRQVKGGSQYKATILLRATHLPDGDIVVTEDEWPFIFAALERARGVH